MLSRYTLILPTICYNTQWSPMLKAVLILLVLTLSLSKESLYPLIILSSNPTIPRFWTFDELISTIKKQHIPYKYFDISARGSQHAHKEKIRELIRQVPEGLVKHSSIVNDQQQHRLRASLTQFNDSNTYTLENFTQAANPTSKIQIDESNLSLSVIKKVGLEHLVILNFHSEAVRVLQQVTQKSSSTMLDVMTPSALSGLLVSVFLLVVLLIAVNCLTDLKTNDRFPRTLLHVGRES